MTYAKLQQMGVTLGMQEARAALASVDAELIEHDRAPDNVRTCSTVFHKGARETTRPPTHFEIRGFNGHEVIFVCRYCMFLIAHAVETKNAKRLEVILEKAQKEIAPPPENGVLEGTEG